MKKHIPLNHQIKNMLAVLAAAILCALLFALLFLYYYGPTGRYIAGQTLLDPSIIEQINYQENHSKKGQKAHFMFDRTEFFYFDPQQGEMLQKIIPLETYQTFYTWIASEKSIEKVTEEIKKIFLTPHLALLTTRMHRIEAVNSSPSTQVFQVVQFVQGDYFRVQLHEAQEQNEWAYFYHPNLYQEVIRLFTQPAGL